MTVPSSALVADLLSRSVFPASGEPLHCALSGGPDSAALTALAVASGCTVTAHHVDHGLRPDSATDASLAHAQARQLGASFVSYEVVVDPGPNLEARAREARFAVLPSSIATGHTMDDRAETMLLNLLRGAARTGLAPHRDQDRHPIIGLRRSETHALCAELGLVVADDPSNRDPVHRRNRVRHELLPLLGDISDRDLVPILDRQADLLAGEDELLDALAGEIDATDAKAIAAAPVPLARRAIRNWITQSWNRGHPPDGDAVERVLDVARGLAVSTEIGGGQRIHRRSQRLRLET